MITIYSPIEAGHDPPHEFMEGLLTRYTEAPVRAAMILEAVQAAQFGPIIAPNEFGLAPILAVHDAAYVEFLRTIYARWCAAGGTPEAALPSCLPLQRPAQRSASPFAEVGYYAFDLSAPIVAGTYDAAVTSAQCALSGAALLQHGERLAYALCRPPGHHASRALMGGFCYFNNAAIAAQYLAPAGRIAILDIDVHHGNGTQSIFYERADVLFVSLHGAPDYEYPYFWGFANEHGQGAGEGFTLNLPLPAGTDDQAFLTALDQALAALREYDPAYLILSAGLDTFAGDPLGKFMLSAQCYPEIGRRVAALGIPTLVVQEGGYTVAALGQNVVALLQGLQP